MSSDSNLPLRITDEDLDRAVVGRLPTSRLPAPERLDARPSADRRWNGVAISAVAIVVGSALVAGFTACVSDEIAGSAAFGAIAGMAAIVLGCAALVRPSRPQLRGTGLAVGGIVAGIASVIGWTAAWSLLAWPAGAPADFISFEPDLRALDNLPAPLRQAMQANVLIEGRTGWKGLGGQTIGSGVILRIAGGKAYVVTNRHVVDPDFKEGARAKLPARGVTGVFSIKLVGQGARPAAVDWVAPDGIDLAIAVVPVESDEPRAAHWVAEVATKIGDEVFAVGNPHGLGWTHTAGAISQFRKQNLHGRTIQVIQTSTAINPGNSGGGLYDAQGRLVGITTWTQDKRVAEGLSFAISFETLLELDPEILKLGAGEPP